MQSAINLADVEVDMPDHLALAPPSSVPHQVEAAPQVVDATPSVETIVLKPRPTVVAVVQIADGPAVPVAAGAFQLLPLGVSAIVSLPENKV